MPTTRLRAQNDESVDDMILIRRRGGDKIVVPPNNVRVAVSQCERTLKMVK